MTEVTAGTEDAMTKSDRETESTRGARIYRPLTDIVEAPDGVTLMLEMPGVGSEDAEIELERGVLTIRGRAKLTSSENFQPVYAEYGEGDYERSFTLSDDLDGSKISAEIRGGVLNVHLPRSEAAKPKKIAIKAG
jgi:HSP20 family protein